MTAKPWGELTKPTPEQYLDFLLWLSPEEQLASVARLLELADKAEQCDMQQHAEALELVRTHRCPSLGEIILANEEAARASGYADGLVQGEAKGRQAVVDGLTAELDAREAERRVHDDDDPQTEYAHHAQRQA